MRKRVERDNGIHCVSGVNPSTGLVDAPNRKEGERIYVRKRVERDSGTHYVSGVNLSTGLVDASNRNYFSQNTPFFYSAALFGPIF